MDLLCIEGVLTKTLSQRLVMASSQQLPFEASRCTLIPASLIDGQRVDTLMSMTSRSAPRCPQQNLVTINVGLDVDRKADKNKIS